MKNRSLFTIAMLAFAFNTQAQNASNYEKRISQPFHYIKIKGELKVSLVKSENHGVIVQGSSYQISNTITLVKDDTLFIFQANVKQNDSRPKVYIYANDLTAMTVNGRTTINVSGFNNEFMGLKTENGASVNKSKTEIDPVFARKDIMQ
jgi:hypothetical protein